MAIAAVAGLAIGCDTWLGGGTSSEGTVGGEVYAPRLDASQGEKGTAGDAGSVADSKTSAVDAAGPVPQFSFVYFDNEHLDFARRGWLDPESDFQRNVRAAGARWAAALVSPHRLVMHVLADRQVPRPAGNYSHGRLVRQIGRKRVWEPGALTRLQTGTNPGAASNGGADLVMFLNASYADSLLFIDPDPAVQTRPRGRIHFVDVVLHEIAHGLGMAGARVNARERYGELVDDDVSLFDALTEFDGDGLPLVNGHPNRLFFVGAQATALLDRRVPLASYDVDHISFESNHYHFGTFSRDPNAPDYFERLCHSGTRTDLVAGSVLASCPSPTDGTRLHINALDLAMLADLGYPVRGY